MLYNKDVDWSYINANVAQSEFDIPALRPIILLCYC